MTKPILVANWKNYPGSLAEAKKLLTELSKMKLLFKKLAFFVAPPLPYMETVSLKAKSFAQLAVQDVFPLAKGTYTGAVPVDILKGFGVKLAILGHSERRALGETNEMIAEKIKVALKSGFVPLVCVGESVRDDDGEHFEFLREQIKASLTGLSKQAVSSLVLAYEPVWAVGVNAKEALAPADLAQSVIFIKKVLTDLFGRKAAESIPVLYGGSVDVGNAGILLKEGGVRGLLVGRASLKPQSMEQIAKSLTEK